MQKPPRRTLGLLPRELAVSPPNAVPEREFQTMSGIFRRLTECLPCCGLVRNFGAELVLQIGEGEPFSVPIPSDWNRTRVEAFESILTQELAARF